MKISKVGGDPTAGASVRIRGTTFSLGGNDPLVVIDGIFGDLATERLFLLAILRPFSILKDASETAQWLVSAWCASVIVVTTKKVLFIPQSKYYASTITFREKIETF